MDLELLKKSSAEIRAEVDLMIRRLGTQKAVAEKMGMDPGYFSKSIGGEGINSPSFIEKFYEVFKEELDKIKSDPDFPQLLGQEHKVSEHNQSYSNLMMLVQAHEDHIQTLKENVKHSRESEIRQADMLYKAMDSFREANMNAKEHIATNKELLANNTRITVLLMRYAPPEAIESELKKNDDKKDTAGEKKTRGEKKGHEDAGKIATEKKRHPEEGNGSNAEASDLP